MHMAMINARASANALNQKGSQEKSGSNSIRLTEREIESIRRESGRDNLQSTREENKTEFLRETKEHDKEILPKCSTCCTMMWALIFSTVWCTLKLLFKGCDGIIIAKKAWKYGYALIVLVNTFLAVIFYGMITIINDNLKNDNRSLEKQMLPNLGT